MVNQENENSYGAYDVLFNEARVAADQIAKAVSKISGQDLIPIADIHRGARLVFSNFSEQPRLVLVESDGFIRPLLDTKDVLGLPAPWASEVVSSLEKLRERRIAAQS